MLTHTNSTGNKSVSEEPFLRFSGTRHTNTHIRLLSRIICWDLGNSFDPKLNCVCNMGNNLYSLAQVCALSISLARLAAATTQRPEICSRYVPFLSSDSTWLKKRSILAKAVHSEPEDTPIDLSGCDVALGTYMSVGSHEFSILFRKN